MRTVAPGGCASAARTVKGAATEGAGESGGVAADGSGAEAGSGVGLPEAAAEGALGVLGSAGDDAGGGWVPSAPASASPCDAGLLHALATRASKPSAAA